MGNIIKGETGRQNAERFFNRVIAQALNERVVIMYIDDWPWMANEEWRVAVMKRLDGTMLRDARFSPPDSLDSWTFHCYSDDARPEAERASLDDTIHHSEDYILGRLGLRKTPSGLKSKDPKGSSFKWFLWAAAVCVAIAFSVAILTHPADATTIPAVRL